MKKKTTISLLFIVIIPVLYFAFAAGLVKEEKISSEILLAPPQIQPKNFINCIFNEWYWTNHSDDLLEHNFGRIKELNFNAVHRYAGESHKYGWFQAPLLDSQKTNKIKLYDSANAKNLKAIYGSPNTEYFCYGQRLVYEAEGGNDGFSYQRRTANTITDSGRKVIHACLPQQTNCPETDATPRWLCDSIYENLQHGDGYIEWDYDQWYIKPMMRIDSSIVDNNPNTLVVRIDAINFRGDLIKSDTIKARNFRDQNLNYPGTYVEAYNFFGDPQGERLQVSGRKDTITGLNYGLSSDWYKWRDSCHVDFKVWWFGQVEVWFDKMTVDDKVGNALFKPAPDNSDSLIIKEVNAYTSHNANYTFFTDEMTYSQIPCLEYVYELIKVQNDDAKLWYAISRYRNMVTVKANSEHFGQSFHLNRVKPELSEH